MTTYSVPKNQFHPPCPTNKVGKVLGFVGVHEDRAISCGDVDRQRAWAWVAKQHQVNSDTTHAAHTATHWGWEVR